MKKLYFCIDIGNSHIVAGIYNDFKLLYQWRLNTIKSRTEDEYFVIFKNLFEESNILLSEIEVTSISSVVPELNAIFNHMLNDYFMTKIVNVTPFIDLGLEFPVENPGYIGADLIVNAYAAKEKYKENSIIIDLGTATTIQLVGKNGLFYGTVISPGIMTSATSLFEKASQLSHIELVKPKSILGLNTKDALLSGIIKGNTIMIEAFIKEIKENYSDLENIKVIATGGLADLICSNSSEVDIIDSQLTLDGLMMICLKSDNNQEN